ncbi:hypothetical protein [Schwartzia succinivorans]|jgi:hypothetical protein|uniref:Uncharacterized protein n=1 Tax=Schwartzia succinivorans DSM 10502 TaxID=1123243 RepID=A0A1M4XB38_9FIRM|nr:hypothetical protein [Schwartzia succinivorans]SHE90402.1 hypothetical protein SAMN02745190_01413 [Schwartzia succinivorans DSM 10502]
MFGKIRAFGKVISDITGISKMFRYKGFGDIISGVVGWLLYGVVLLILLDWITTGFLRSKGDLLEKGILMILCAGAGWCLKNAAGFTIAIAIPVVSYYKLSTEFNRDDLMVCCAFVLLCTLVYIAVLLTIQVSKIKEEEESERRRVEWYARLENHPYVSALRELAELEELGKGLEDHGGIDAKKRCETIVEAVEKLGEEYLNRHFTENGLAKIEEYKKRIRDAREKNEAERLK